MSYLVQEGMLLYMPDRYQNKGERPPTYVVANTTRPGHVRLKSQNGGYCSQDYEVSWLQKWMRPYWLQPADRVWVGGLLRRVEGFIHGPHNEYFNIQVTDWPILDIFHDILGAADLQPCQVQ